MLATNLRWLQVGGKCSYRPTSVLGQQMGARAACAHSACLLPFPQSRPSMARETQIDVAKAPFSLNFSKLTYASENASLMLL